GLAARDGDTRLWVDAEPDVGREPGQRRLDAIWIRQGDRLREAAVHVLEDPANGRGGGSEQAHDLGTRYPAAASSAMRAAPPAKSLAETTSPGAQPPRARVVTLCLGATT